MKTLPRYLFVATLLFAATTGFALAASTPQAALGSVPFPGGAANMQGDPIPGVDVELEQNPGSVMRTVQVGADGSVHASGFTPGATVILRQGALTLTLKANAKGEVSIPPKPIRVELK